MILLPFKRLLTSSPRALVSSAPSAPSAHSGRTSLKSSPQIPLVPHLILISSSFSALQEHPSTQKDTVGSCNRGPDLQPKVSMDWSADISPTTALSASLASLSLDKNPSSTNSNSCTAASNPASVACQSRDSSSQARQAATTASSLQPAGSSDVTSNKTPSPGPAGVGEGDQSGVDEGLANRLASLSLE